MNPCKFVGLLWGVTGMSDKQNLVLSVLFLALFMPSTGRSEDDAIFTVVPTVFTSEIKKYEVTTRLKEHANAFEENVNHALITELKRAGFKYVTKNAPVVFEITVTRESENLARRTLANNDFTDATNIVITASMNGRSVWEGSIYGKTEDVGSFHTGVCIRNLLHQYDQPRADDEDCNANP